jgi:hypothetical protein
MNNPKEKAMKKIHFLISILFVITSISIISCNKDDANNDPQPVTDPRDQYTGNWTCTEVSQLYPSQTPFSVGISLSTTNSSQILISNFYHFGTTESAIAVVTDNTLAIPQQTICSMAIHGSGTMETSTKITLNYYVNDAADIDTVSASYIKQ